MLGRGGAGKTTVADELGRLLELPVLELDRYFWSADLTPTAAAEWADRQHELAADSRWIMDGDLGRYDVLPPRLSRADTVLILDFGLLRCAWRATRRSRERLDFWWWVLTWRRGSRPLVLRAIATYAPSAAVYRLKNPRQLHRLLRRLPAR